MIKKTYYAKIKRIILILIFVMAVETVRPTVDIAINEEMPFILAIRF